MPEKKVFLYHASAVAFGGQITLPFQEILEGQATCAQLNVGYSQARVENYRYKNFVSFGAAHSQTVGSFSRADNAYFSLASVSIEKINILDMITCDRIISRVSAKHINMDGAQSEITPLGCSFENLRIDGRLLDIQMATGLFNDFSTGSSLRKAETEGVKELAALSLGQSRGPLSGYTMVANDTHFGFKNHELDIPQFGTVRLAQLFCSSNARRVSMLEVTLGCPGEGDLGFGGTAGNGDPWP